MDERTGILSQDGQNYTIYGILNNSPNYSKYISQNNVCLSNSTNPENVTFVPLLMIVDNYSQKIFTILYGPYTHDFEWFEAYEYVIFMYKDSNSSWLPSFEL